MGQVEYTQLFVEPQLAGDMPVDEKTTTERCKA